MTVFVECKADEMTVVTLGVPKRSVTHFEGKGEVCNALREQTSATGLVDEDPFAAQPSYLKALKAADPEDGIKVLVDQERQNRVIVICPRLEDWLVATVRNEGVDLNEFGFTAKDARWLHAEINERLPALDKLLRALLEAKSKPLVRLKKLLRN